MSKLNLFTWVDVRRFLAQQTCLGREIPAPIVRITCFSSAVEVGLKTLEDEQVASNILKGWFGRLYYSDTKRPSIRLEDGNRLPVKFCDGENKKREQFSLRPLWSEIVHCKRDDQAIPPAELKFDIPITAFHSFKGGAESAISLAVHLFALQKQAVSSNQGISVLVIDAAFHSPILSWWEKGSGVSFLHYLDLCQFNSRLDFFIDRLKESARYLEKASIYFLPAFLDEQQLLDPWNLPQNLVTNLNNPWQFGDSIHKLGQALRVDHILLDLGTGLTESAAPALFDPRIERTLITSSSQDSIKGTKLVLEQIEHLAPLNEGAGVRVINLSFFEEDFFRVDSWEDAQKLNGTAIMSHAIHWARKFNK